jgi:hypothetical protein
MVFDSGDNARGVYRFGHAYTSRDGIQRRVRVRVIGELTEKEKENNNFTS